MESSEIKFSRIETAGMSLETLIECLKRVNKNIKVDDKERCRYYRDVIIYTQNFIEVFYKAILSRNNREDKKIIKQYCNINNKNVKFYYHITFKIIIWKLIQKRIIDEEQKKNLVKLNTIRNNVNHSAMELDDNKIYTILLCLQVIVPMIINKKEELNIGDKNYKWITSESNLIAVFILMQPKVQKIVKSIVTDRYPINGPRSCNNYFMTADINNIDGIANILHEKYNLINDKELKDTLKMLIKHNFIQECESIDEYGQYESNGIIFRRNGLNIYAINNLKTQGDYIKKLFGIR